MDTSTYKLNENVVKHTWLIMRWKCFKAKEIEEQEFERLPHATTHGDVHPRGDKVINSPFNHNESGARQNLAVITIS